jgi:hypothetical protein
MNKQHPPNDDLNLIVKEMNKYSIGINAICVVFGMVLASAYWNLRPHMPPEKFQLSFEDTIYRVLVPANHKELYTFLPGQFPGLDEAIKNYQKYP